MKIGIIPAVQIRYKNQIEHVIDTRWFDFFKKKYSKKFKFEILNFNSQFCHDLLIITGGNDLLSLKKNNANLIREKLDNRFFSLAKKNNIPVIGVCHGAMYIANKYNAKLNKSKNHLKDHLIIPTSYGKKNNLRTIKTNSYHNFTLSSLSNKFDILMKSKDNKIESFLSKDKKILGIMWHPERFKNFRKFDFNIFDLIK